MNEIFERLVICDAQRRIGYASVRYPQVGNKNIDRYYKRLSEAFLGYADKNKLCGTLDCRISYEDESTVSVTTVSRLYNGRECVRRHSSSLVWNREQGTLQYLRRYGIRRCNISYNGRELSIFN